MLHKLATFSFFLSNHGEFLERLEYSTKDECIRYAKTMWVGGLFLRFGLPFTMAVIMIVTTLLIPAYDLDYERPAAGGAPPTAWVEDTTGFISTEYATSSIEQSCREFQKNANIYPALYSTNEPVASLKAVYDDFFEDEYGLLVVLEDYKDHAKILFYEGAEIAGVLNLQDLERVVKSELARYTTDRAADVMGCLSSSVNKSVAVRSSSSKTLDYLAKVFVCLVAYFVGLLAARALFTLIGIPYRHEDALAMIEARFAMDATDTPTTKVMGF